MASDPQRRALTGTDEKIVLTLKQKSQCECSAQSRQRGSHRIDRATTLHHLVIDQMSDHFAIGFGFEFGALGLQLVTQLAKILNDAVVNDGNAISGMGVRIVLVWPSVSSPTRVPDPDRSVQRFAFQPTFQIFEFALRTPGRQAPSLQSGHARGVVTAILEPFESIDKLLGDRLTPENSDDSAHLTGPFEWI
jgi:hypothetical protein